MYNVWTFFIEHVGKATMKNYKYSVKKNLSIDEPGLQ